MILAIVLCVIKLKVEKIDIQLLDDFILLFPAMIFFIFVSSQTGFSRHFRYVLPVFPFVFIAISQVFEIAFKRSYFLRFLTCFFAIDFSRSNIFSFSAYNVIL